MEKKSKNLIRRAVLALIGKSGIYRLASFILKRRYKVSAICFPINISEVKEILLILPQSPIDVLYQLQNITGIASLFKHAGVTLVCERQTTSLVKMIPGLNVIEYDLDSSRTFSKQFTGLAKEFRGIVDICFLLDHKPDLPLLYLAGASAAPTRVGYYGAGEFPFLNLQVSPSKQRKYIPDLNCSISDLFGAKPEGVCWSVAPKVLDEIDHLLRESKIKRKGSLIGVDALFLFRKFGQQCAEQFLCRFKELNNGEMYLYADHIDSGKETEWLKTQKLPVLTHLSESRTAALVSRSDLIITGNTLLYVVAGLLNRPAIGFFHETEIESYCPQSANQKGISFKGVSEKETVEMLDRAICLIESFQLKSRSQQ